MPAAYVTSQIATFSVTTAFDSGSGLFLGSHTFPYAIGAGDTLMVMLIADGIDFHTITDDGGNSWTIDDYNLGSAVVSITKSANPTTQIVFTFLTGSAGVFAVNLIFGEYSGFLGSKSLSVISQGSPPLTKIVVAQTTTPPPGVKVQFGFVGAEVWAGFVTVDAGFHNPGVNFIGPDATYGGTQRQVINEYVEVGAPAIISFALVDNMAGVTGLSETTDAPFTSGGWGAYYSLSSPTDGNIVIHKVTSLGGSPQSFTFIPSYGAPFSLTDGQSNDSGPLTPGTYSVVETPVAGWTTTTSSNPAAIVVTAGNTTVVTFTNTLVPTTGNIIISKATVPGGSGQSFTFTPSYGVPFTLTDGQSNDSGPLAPGTYSVVETPITGWTTATSSNPASIVVTAGNTTTVTFTNTAPGTIIIHKVTNPPGSPQAFDFTPSYGAPFTLHDGESNNSGPLIPGTYAVVETPVANWTTATSSNPSAINVTPGSTTNITFTNTLAQQPGRIIVSKVTIPASTQQFAFTSSYGAPFTLANGQSRDSGALAPGTYSVAEAAATGWTSTPSTDPANLVVAAGQTVTITFTNRITGGGSGGGGMSGTINTCGKVLTLVDTWELDNGLDDWPTDRGTPIAWWETTLPQQKLAIAKTPANNGLIGLLYVALAVALGAGFGIGGFGGGGFGGANFTVPDDWTPYILYGTLAELLSSDGPSFDPVRADYCSRRYQEGIELARLVLGGQ